MMERKTIRYLIRRLAHHCTVCVRILDERSTSRLLISSGWWDVQIALLTPVSLRHKRRRRCADERRQSQREKLAMLDRTQRQRHHRIYYKIYIDDSMTVPSYTTHITCQLPKYPWITVPRVMARIIARVQPVNVIHEYISSIIWVRTYPGILCVLRWR